MHILFNVNKQSYELFYIILLIHLKTLTNKEAIDILCIMMCMFGWRKHVRNKTFWHSKKMDSSQQETTFYKWAQKKTYWNTWCMKGSLWWEIPKHRAKVLLQRLPEWPSIFSLYDILLWWKQKKLIHITFTSTKRPHLLFSFPDAHFSLELFFNVLCSLLDNASIKT